MHSWNVGWCECRPIGVGTLIGIVGVIAGYVALDAVSAVQLAARILPAEPAGALRTEWVAPTILLLVGSWLGSVYAGYTGTPDLKHGVTNGYFAAFSATFLVETSWIVALGLFLVLAPALSGAFAGALVVFAILAVVLVFFAVVTGTVALPGLLFGYVGVVCRRRREASSP